MKSFNVYGLIHNLFKGAVSGSSKSFFRCTKNTFKFKKTSNNSSFRNIHQRSTKNNEPSQEKIRRSPHSLLTNNKHRWRKIKMDFRTINLKKKRSLFSRLQDAVSVTLLVCPRLPSLHSRTISIHVAYSSRWMLESIRQTRNAGVARDLHMAYTEPLQCSWEVTGLTAEFNQRSAVLITPSYNWLTNKETSWWESEVCRVTLSTKEAIYCQRLTSGQQPLNKERLLFAYRTL